MKVKDLIDQLQKVDPEYDVATTYEEYVDPEDSCGVTVVRDVDGVSQFDKCVKLETSHRTSISVFDSIDNAFKQQFSFPVREKKGHRR